MTQPAPEYWKWFEQAADPRKAFREAIETELPAFTSYLLTLEIPTNLKGRRYGVTSFIPADVAQDIFEQEPEHLLLLLIDKQLFDEGFDGNETWKGDAEHPKQALCAENSSVRPTATRLLGSYPTACGQLISRLASQFPTRIKKHRTADKRE